MEINISHTTMRTYCINYNFKNRTDGEKVYNKKQKYWKKRFKLCEFHFMIILVSVK